LHAVSRQLWRNDHRGFRAHPRDAVGTNAARRPPHGYIGPGAPEDDRLVGGLHGAGIGEGGGWSCPHEPSGQTRVEPSLREYDHRRRTSPRNSTMFRALSLLSPFLRFRKRYGISLTTGRALTRTSRRGLFPSPWIRTDSRKDRRKMKNPERGSGHSARSNLPAMSVATKLTQ